jgi:hypothetical protein
MINCKVLDQIKEIVLDLLIMLKLKWEVLMEQVIKHIMGLE